MIKLITIRKSGEMIEVQGVSFEELKKISATGHVLSPFTEGTPTGFRVFFKRTDQLLLLDEETNEPLLYEGKQIYRYPDGKLINIDGTSVTATTNNDESIYLDKNNQLVTGNGVVLSDDVLPIKKTIKLEPIKCVLITHVSREVRMFKNPSTLLTNMKQLGIEEGNVDLENWDVKGSYDPILSASKKSETQSAVGS